MLNVLSTPPYFVGYNITSAIVSINVTKPYNSQDTSKRQSLKLFPEELRKK
jgi:hypothetical protein